MLQLLKKNVNLSKIQECCTVSDKFHLCQWWCIIAGSEDFYIFQDTQPLSFNIIQWYADLKIVFGHTTDWKNDYTMFEQWRTELQRQSNPPFPNRTFPHKWFFLSIQKTRNKMELSSMNYMSYTKLLQKKSIMPWLRAFAWLGFCFSLSLPLLYRWTIY